MGRVAFSLAVGHGQTNYTCFGSCHQGPKVFTGSVYSNFRMSTRANRLTRLNNCVRTVLFCRSVNNSANEKTAAYAGTRVFEPSGSISALLPLRAAATVSTALRSDLSKRWLYLAVVAGVECPSSAPMVGKLISALTN